MVNRIVLSLLSVGMVASTAQGAQDSTGNRSYFYFDKGAAGNEILYGRYRSLFPHNTFDTASDISESEQAAFVQSLKEISHNSRVAAKDGFFYGLKLGSLCGVVAGGLIGTIIGYFSKTSDSHFANQREQKKINALLKGLKGMLWGTIAGGLAGAGFYTTVAVDESIRLNSPSACSEYCLNHYCTLAHDHAYNQLIDFSATTPELAVILIKARNGIELSDTEKQELNTSSIPFSTFDSTYYVRKASLAEVVETLNNTDASQRSRIATIVKWGNKAQEYAQNNKMAALMAASKDDITLANLYGDLTIEDHFNRVQ